MNESNTAVIIGGGIMGSDIAAIFFAAGWNTQVVETNPAARGQLETAVPAAAKVAGIDHAGGSVRALASLSEIDWTGARLVIECVSEN
ncbi:MAG: 3-hydroxyacyl-CoA dehydrogenase NAD-binding domain-containing protein, partial [Burkholderiaceae bacterium]